MTSKPRLRQHVRPCSLHLSPPPDMVLQCSMFILSLAAGFFIQNDDIIMF